MPANQVRSNQPHTEDDGHPPLIAGIYEACDQWCMYCPATDRCRAFLCTSADEHSGVWDAGGGERFGDAMMFLKALADAEGRLAPPEVEAVLSGDRDRQRRMFRIDDPLERLGRSCMNLAEAYLATRADFPPDIVWRRSGATALEVLTWYHGLVSARVFRAILCDSEARAGAADRHIDALRAAKVALIGLDRSRTALAEIARQDDDPRLELLGIRWQQLGDAIEARFPGARAFVRAGLDPEIAKSSWLQRCFQDVRRRLPWPRP